MTEAMEIASNIDRKFATIDAARQYLKNNAGIQPATEQVIDNVAEWLVCRSTPFYVTMTDRFFSGWGAAEGKTNKLIVMCETIEQAEQIEAAAKDRPEMRHVSIRETKPRAKANQWFSWRHYDELGGRWNQ